MGYSINKEFPGRFIRGDDVVGHEANLVIKDVKKENVFSTKKNANEASLVVFFEGRDKGVMLSKARAMDIKKITKSDDTDNWKGKTVCIYTVKKDAFGEELNVIRFKAPKA